MRWLAMSGALLIVGVGTLWWAFSLAAFLVPICSNHFGFSDAPSARCLQPVLGEIAGAALVSLGVASGAIALVQRRREAQPKQPPTD